MTEKEKSRLKRYTWADVAKSEIVKVTVPTGHSVEFIKADDMFFPRMDGIDFPDQRLNTPRVRQMKAHADDILICAFPKVGTHWTWEIVHMLLKGKADYSEKSKMGSMLEFNLPEVFDNWQPPRVFNTHFEFHHIPEDMINKKCKIIYIQRNPKDTAVSLFNFLKTVYGESFTGSWNDFFHMFLQDEHFYMSWFRSTLSWENAIKAEKSVPILSLFYEDLKKDSVTEIKRIADFLEVKYDEKLIKKITEKCEFHEMKTAQVNLRNDEIEKMQLDENVKVKVITVLTDGVFRKGDVGDWKNWFTVAQEEKFDVIYAEKMKDSKLQFKYVL